jgi:acyl carrier protein
MAIPVRLVEFLNQSRDSKPPIGDPDELLHIDSLGMIRLMSFIQDDMGILIDDDEMTLENFDTLRSIERLLQRKGASEETTKESNQAGQANPQKEFRATEISN